MTRATNRERVAAARFKCRSAGRVARLHFRFPRSDSARNQHSATVRVYRNAILKGNAIESRALYYEKNKNGTTNDLLFRLFFRLLLISHKEMCQMCLPSKEVNLNWKIK